MVDFKLLQPQPGGVFPGFPGCHQLPYFRGDSDVNFSATSFQSHPRPSISFQWVIPKLGEPQNGWFVMENPIKMDDLGVPLFSETSKSVFFCLAGKKPSTGFVGISVGSQPPNSGGFPNPTKSSLQSGQFGVFQPPNATMPPSLPKEIWRLNSRAC